MTDLHLKICIAFRDAERAVLSWRGERSGPTWEKACVTWQSAQVALCRSAREMANQQQENIAA